MATTILALLSFSGAAVADNFYVGAEAGVSVLDMDTNRKHFDDSSNGLNLGLVGGYNKDLNFGVLNNRGTDSVKFEGLVSYRNHNYGRNFNTKFFGHNVRTNIGAELETWTFLPGVQYDAKSLYVYKDDRMLVRPYIAGGAGVAHHDLSSVSGRVTVDGKSGTFTGKGSDNTDFAWYIGAGFNVDIGSSWELSVGYRYEDLGSVSSGNRIHVTGGPNLNVGKTRADLTASTVMIRGVHKF